MKMGQISIDLSTGDFVLQLPDGPRPVILRARHDGVVCIDDDRCRVNLLPVNIQRLQSQTVPEDGLKTLAMEYLRNKGEV